jgi:hypothetical protein
MTEVQMTPFLVGIIVLMAIGILVMEFRAAKAEERNPNTSEVRGAVAMLVVAAVVLILWFVWV